MLAAVLLATLLAGCGPGQPRTPRHVVLITIDTLRADHMSVYGYPRATTPRIQALADAGVVFERAIAQWPKTGPSMASAFIGQYPQTTGITHKAAVKLPEAYLTLPELFQRQGFHTIAAVSNGVLAERLGWDAGFDEYLATWPKDGIPPGKGALRKLMAADQVNALALPALERHAEGERLFLWLHYYDPHSPYLLPEGTENPFLGDAHYRGGETVHLEALGMHSLAPHRELKYYVAQYDANILVVDRAVGEVIDRMRSLEMLDDTLIVLTSDHGESLGEHDLNFGHGRHPYNTTAHVPLLFFYPGAFDARRVAEPVELVDLYPTLRDLIAPDHEIPGLEGDSLVPRLIGDQPPEQAPEAAFAFSQAGDRSVPHHYRSIQDSTWKLVYHPPVYRRKRQVKPELYELYNLEQDPLETENLAEIHVDQLRRLRRELFAWMNGQWIMPRRSYAVERSKETLEALRALGYIE